MIYSRHGEMKCVKIDPKKVKKKDRRCERKPCRINYLKQNEDQKCTLYQSDNVTYHSKKTLVHVPIPIKSGMKMTVWGAYREGKGKSQITFTLKPTKPLDIRAWWHIDLNWNRHSICFSKGFSVEGWYKGNFPVLDPSNFSFTVESTRSTTKIYLENVLVKSKKLIPLVKEVNLRKYSKVFLMVIQKTDEECAKLCNREP